MYTQTDIANLSEDDKKRKKHSVQMEIIMLESDLKKMNNTRNELDAQIRKLKYDEERLRIELDNDKKQFEKVVYEITQNEAEIKRLKKQLNLL